MCNIFGMGNRVGAFVTKPIKDFNIENRAHRVVGAEKPKPAPRHPTEQKYESQSAAVDENVVHGKREDLIERLKVVKVVSTDIEHEPEETASRQLPQSRSSWQQYEYGYYEPEVVPAGRVTLRQAVQLLTDANADPSQFTPEALATQYKLQVEDVRNVVRYFRPFNVYSPSAEPKEHVASKFSLDNVSSIIGLNAPPKKAPHKDIPSDKAKEGNKESGE